MRLLILLAQLAVPVAPPAPVAPISPLAPVAPLSATRPVLAPRPVALHLDESFHALAEAVAPALALAQSLTPHVGAISGPEMRSYPQDPADSLYREARKLLNQGEWRRASALFVRVADHKPASAYAADALYWHAFALYRIGSTPELRTALAALDARKTRFPDARSTGEATALATRIRGALASRGDQAASAALAAEARAGTQGCDEEELSVRSSALNALMRSDPEAAQSLLTRVLDRKDECSIPLRKNAVMLIGTRGDAAAKAKLASVARADASPEVRADAIGYLARVSGDEVIAALDAVIRNDEEQERVRRAAVRALGSHESARARTAIRALVERSTAPEALRLEALSTFERGTFSHSFSTNCQGDGCSYTVPPTPPTPPTPATPPTPPTPAAAPRPGQGVSAATSEAMRDRLEAERDRLEADRERMAADRERMAIAMSQQSRERRISPEDAAWLRGVYPRLETTRLRSRAVSVLARAGDDATQAWLMGLIQRDEEPADVRATILSRLGRDLPIAQLNRLYDTAPDRTVRQQIVSTLGERNESEATDKLIEIVKTGTDPQLRRSAISALGRKKDPRATKLLLELIDK